MSISVPTMADTTALRAVVECRDLPLPADRVPRRGVVDEDLVASRAIDRQRVAPRGVRPAGIEQPEDGLFEGHRLLVAGPQRHRRLRDEQRSPARAIQRVELVAAREAPDALRRELGVGVQVVRDDGERAVELVRAEDPVGALELPAARVPGGAGGDDKREGREGPDQARAHG